MYTCRADTIVLKDTESFAEFSGADPVISSHWDGLLPPGKKIVTNELLKNALNSTILHIIEEFHEKLCSMAWCKFSHYYQQPSKR